MQYKLKASYVAVNKHNSLKILANATNYWLVPEPPSSHFFDLFIQFSH